MKNIIIFASGSGSNAETIIRHFENSDYAHVAAIFTNRTDAGVIERAKKYHIPSEVFSKIEFSEVNFLEKVNSYKPDLIVLAGFLLKVPDYFIKAFPDKIVNIHPALLPKYGGKGMYGSHVHQAVFENKETVSGMTIHFVNEHYDEGNIIFQESVNIEDCQNPEEVAHKVLVLEHKNYPVVIEKLLNAGCQVSDDRTQHPTPNI
ncbi:MAG: phosphoribosylglycinamide formyltransferase [Flavobacteriaceae bacterium]